MGGDPLGEDMYGNSNESGNQDVTCWKKLKII